MQFKFHFHQRSANRRESCEKLPGYRSWKVKLKNCRRFGGEVVGEKEEIHCQLGTFPTSKTTNDSSPQRRCDSLLYSGLLWRHNACIKYVKRITINNICIFLLKKYLKKMMFCIFYWIFKIYVYLFTVQKFYIIILTVG